MAINGDDEFEITHAESYSVLIPKGDHTYHISNFIGTSLTDIVG